MTMPPVLSLVPPPVPPTPEEEENAVREEMLRALAWEVGVSAPDWREVMFLGKPRPLSLPPIPRGVVERISNIDPQRFAQDPTGIKALALAEKLNGLMPSGGAPRSMGAASTLPAPRDAMQSWERTALVAATGPDVVPLLASNGSLTYPDVDFLDEVYPAGMEAQRLAATAASAPIASAAQRAGEYTAFPSWLDDQLFTLIGEPRDTKQYQALYEPAPQQQPGPSAGAGAGVGGDSKIASQFRPTPSPEST